MADLGRILEPPDRESAAHTEGEGAGLVHDALGHPRSAARVEHVDVGARAFLARAGLGAFDEILVTFRPGDVGKRTAVVDLEKELHLRQTRTNLLDARRELAVEEHCFGVGVVEEIDQLLRLIAVIHVDRTGAELERTEVRFRVLVAVVEVEADLRSLGDAPRLERRRQARRAVLELAPRAHHALTAQGRRVRHLIRDQFPRVREVEVHPSPSPGQESCCIESRSRAPVRRAAQRTIGCALRPLKRRAVKCSASRADEPAGSAKMKAIGAEMRFERCPGGGDRLGTGLVLELGQHARNGADLPLEFDRTVEIACEPQGRLEGRERHVGEAGFGQQAFDIGRIREGEGSGRLRIRRHIGRGQERLYRCSHDGHPGIGPWGLPAYETQPTIIGERRTEIREGCNGIGEEHDPEPRQDQIAIGREFGGRGIRDAELEARIAVGARAREFEHRRGDVDAAHVRRAARHRFERRRTAAAAHIEDAATIEGAGVIEHGIGDRREHGVEARLRSHPGLTAGSVPELDLSVVARAHRIRLPDPWRHSIRSTVLAGPPPDRAA